ncbi:MAG: hypothetical protein U0T74_01120 [Chitinophagales bacterium]
MKNLYLKTLIVLICLLLAAGSCKQRKPAAKPTKEQLHYLDYRKIFSAYKSAPLYYSKEMLDSFLLAYPTDSRAWAFYGRVKYDMNLPEEAMVAYRNSIRFDSLSSEGYLGLGSVFNVLNNYDSAEFYLNKALLLNDSSAYTYLNLSMLKMKQGQVAQSLALADSTFLREDSSAVICSGLSYVYDRLKLPAKSTEMFARAAALNLKDTASFREVMQGKLKLEDYYRKNKY